MLGGSRCKAGPTLEPATNPRLSGFPSQSAHASASARTNDHLYCIECRRASAVGQITVFESAGQDTQSVFGVGRCSKKRSCPGLPVCIGGMKSRPPFSAVSPTIT
jgi:hypothetical protein